MARSPDPVRWGIVGTATIARAQFLPGLTEAGGGRAVLVASRDRARADAYAAANGIDGAVGDYAALVESPHVDAVYVALPNALHAEWAIRALQAGKAVLCEKPLCVGVAQTQEVLAAAATLTAPLWEAFVFPFQAQHQRLIRLLADGAAGVVSFGRRRLLFSCGFRRPYDTFTRVLGRAGGIALTNPFHPGPADTLTIAAPRADPIVERPTTDERSFTAAIRHIHAVLRGEAAQEHTAAESSLPAARILQQLQEFASPAGDPAGRGG